MMKYRIAIVDDDISFLNRFSQLLLTYNPDFLINQYKSLTEYKQSQESIDALFLDYELKDGTAFDYLESLQHADFLCIIITYHSQIVYHSFQYQPFWFIRKCYMDQDFSSFYPSFIKKLHQLHTYIEFQSENQIIRLKRKSIYYIEKEKNYILIHSDQDYRIRSTYRHFIKENNLSHFVSPIYGVLINPLFIQHIYFSKRYIVLNNGVIFNISRRQFDNFSKQYQDYLLDF